MFSSPGLSPQRSLHDSSVHVQQPESVKANTHEVVPTTDILQILPKPPEVGKHDDDLLIHQDRIDAIDAHLVRVGDAVSKVFVEINGKMQKVAQKHGSPQKWPKLDEAMENLVRNTDKARSLLSQGKFDLAEKVCDEAWDEFQKAYEPLEKELFGCIDEKLFDKQALIAVFSGAKAVIKDSLEVAKGLCKVCNSYLIELNKAASVPLVEPNKSLVEAAQKELVNARALLQDILDGNNQGDIREAEEGVKKAAAKYHALTWPYANNKIAKLQRERKAQLAAALIPSATRQKIITLATQTFGTPAQPAEVELNGRRYEVAHDRGGTFQVVEVPAMGEGLGAGFSNVVILAYNTNKVSLQALRKSRTPEGQAIMEKSLAIHHDITGLEGTTSGPEAVVRKGRGGVLSYVYGDNAKKWLEKMPPPELRWNAFKSATKSFAEFTQNGNVHGDIALVNLSVDYEQGSQGVYAAPRTLKLEDLDGACHIIEGTDGDGQPIYSAKAVSAGMTPAYGTPGEILTWMDCLERGDLAGIAKVRFPQDVLCMGISLYQMITGDIDLQNLYLNMERTPRNNKPGEDGEFLRGTPNTESIRLALEDFDFLTSKQKVAIVKFLSLALNLDPKERAKSGDFAALVAEF